MPITHAGTITHVVLVVGMAFQNGVYIQTLCVAVALAQDSACNFVVHFIGADIYSYNQQRHRGDNAAPTNSRTCKISPASSPFVSLDESMLLWYLCKTRREPARPFTYSETYHLISEFFTHIHIT